jgi:hypothetical protein
VKPSLSSVEDASHVSPCRTLLPKVSHCNILSKQDCQGSLASLKLLCCHLTVNSQLSIFLAPPPPGLLRLETCTGLIDFFVQHRKGVWVSHFCGLSSRFAFGVLLLHRHVDFSFPPHPGLLHQSLLKLSQPPLRP